MITRLTLTNFKAHANTSLDLGPLTILVGPNGVGKTSILDAMHCFGQLAQTKPAELFVGVRGPEHLVRRGPERQSFEIREEGRRDDGTEWAAAAEVGLPDGSGNVPAMLTVPSGTRFQTNGGSSFVESEPSPLWKEAGAVVKFRFDARAIASVGFSNHPTPRVEHDGANTAAALAGMKLTDDERFTATLDALKKVVPCVEGLSVKPVESRNESGEVVGFNGYRFTLHFHGAPGVAAHGASEGTLVTLALLTAINARSRPRLVLVDDIEQSLHPTAQVALVQQLKTLLEQNPKLQIVATTHSPYILDGVDPENVYVFARRDDGSAVARRLSEHPEAARMKGSLTSGQLWSLDPEASWVPEKAPEPGA